MGDDHPRSKSLAQKIEKFEFAKKHLVSTNDGWGWAKILWSNANKFNLFSYDGIQYVRRPKNKKMKFKYLRCYQIPIVKHGGGSVMV